MARLPMTFLGRRAEDAFRPLERWLERGAFPGWGALPWSEEAPATYPVDMREEDGKVIVEAEVPGFSRDQIDVRIEGDVLRIRAERRQEQTQGTPYLSERRYTRVERALTLPAEVDEDRVRASLQNGVLRLEMPETEPRKARRVPIETSQ